MSDLKLSFDLKFLDLYETRGLARIDELFMNVLAKINSELHDRLVAARAAPEDCDRKAEADLLLELSPYVDRFVTRLFGVEQEVAALRAEQDGLADLYTCKRNFVQRHASKVYDAEAAAEFDGPALERQLTRLFGGAFDQLSFAKKVTAWRADEEANAEPLDIAARYAAWALYTKAGKERHVNDVLFHKPEKMVHDDLVPFDTVEECGVTKMQHPAGTPEYPRDGFGLTDEGTDLIGGLDQMNYCVLCHDRGRDYCSKGMPDKKNGGFAVNPLGIKQAGCPLEEKISEMHKAKLDGNPLAALAIITVDNPMCAATGHRICNDCMKSCIYQKQDPVNIPQTETRVLKDVLELPWGFEIYGLMTRWNPLNIRQPLPHRRSGYKVLVVGAGPAGFSLSHFLLNAGHTVALIDGLKIEPLPSDISGIEPTGNRVPFRPIRDVRELYESLDSRIMAGFGGVAEYGITVRWNKNFLKIIRLLLERRRCFSMQGGVRFGSALTAETAFEIGFDHVALCMGAGKPTILGIPNGLARGVRQASDFLMALQLTGAAKTASIANLQVRLPAVVIGGGLTAIDTATEVLAYYVRQVQKFADRYDALVAEHGDNIVRAPWTEEELAIADEFLAHATAIRTERACAFEEGRRPNFSRLLKEWGGATIAYRRKMADAPSYTLNHEEIVKAFEQGIYFAELLAPVSIDIDEYKHCKSITLARQTIGEDGRPKPTGDNVTLPARAILIAAGTQPNTVLAREHPGFAEMDGKYFQAVDEQGDPVSPERIVKPKEVNVLMDLRDDGRAMSFFGDLHPSYAGNVVKAVASAKQGAPVVDRVLRRREPSDINCDQMIARLDHGLRTTVHDVVRLTPNIVEVIIRAPLAAKAFKPGQFFRLQNLESHATRVNGTRLGMEGVALTGAWVDKQAGLVSVIVLEMGGSSSLCSLLKPGEPVVLMGPTGAPTETPGGETVLLAGGGLGNAVLFSIGQAFKAAGSRVLYFAAYKGPNDRYHIDNIKKAADEVIWCCDVEPGFTPDRPQDRAFVGNVVQAMAAYGKGELGEVTIPLSEVNRIIAIGSDLMMNAVKEARHGVLREFLADDHIAYGSINSPMQCMMKEICAQCLQPHRDPDTGKESVVFSCFNQDQELDKVQFPALRQRLTQNSVHEKLTRQWITRCLDKLQDTHTRV